MYTDKKLKPIYENQPYEDAIGTQYPVNFPRDEISGLVKVTETPRPIDPNFIVTGFEIDETFTQVWQKRPKTQQELADENKQSKLAARQAALAARWSDAFAMWDDVLARGIDAVKAERDAIKSANPKE